MNITIRRFQPGDLDTVFAIQRAAFLPLYEKYHDDATSHYMERKETVLRKYMRPGTTGYVFFADGIAVGAVRISTDTGRGRVSALCVLPEHQGKGIAQTALREIERLHSDIVTWHLDTILEEAGNCHLYEKIGYVRTGQTEQLKENMTLVYYEKRVCD